ncbi:MAG TPA: hypothetical protein VGL60_00550 [Acidimicrobiales bacterium]
MRRFPRLGLELELPPIGSPQGVATDAGWAAEVDVVAAVRRHLGGVWCAPPRGGRAALADPLTFAAGLTGSVGESVGPSVGEPVERNEGPPQEGSPRQRPATEHGRRGPAVGAVVEVGAGRHPAVLARDVLTLDAVCGGRAALALRETPERSGIGDLGRLAEAVAICRAIFTGSPPPVTGRHFARAALDERRRAAPDDGPAILLDLDLGAEGAGPALGGVDVGAFDGGDRGDHAETAMLLESVDGLIVGGEPATVAEVRSSIERAAAALGLGTVPAVLWRAPIAARRPAWTAGGPDGIIVSTRDWPLPPAEVLGAELARWAG